MQQNAKEFKKNKYFCKALQIANRFFHHFCVLYVCWNTHLCFYIHKLENYPDWLTQP